MSMIGYLLRVTQTELESYLEDSSLLEAKVYPADDIEDAGLLDIDKSWEGILFLLTGGGIADIEDAQPPLSWALFSGQVIDEEQDLGYGPANYCDASQVKQVAAALEQLPPSVIQSRYDAGKMSELGLYPEVWKEEGVVDYLLEYYTLMRDFYTKAAQNNEAVITYVA